MGLDSLGAETYDIQGYFGRLTVGQRNPGFWGVTALCVGLRIIDV